MKNSSLKGVFGILAAVGIAVAVKKMSDRKRTIKGIFEEYDIKERSPFGFADKIREMDNEKYAEMKSKIIAKFASNHCCKRNHRRQHTEA